MAVGCGGDSDAGGEVTDSSRPTTTATSPSAGTGPQAQRVVLGREVYLQAGCDACHGENAEGTRIAPALPGHSRDQLRKQVRAPLATMPAYPESQISDDDLESLADYIASLPRPKRHVEPVDLSEAVATHHWLAISALTDENRAEALHHVSHITNLVRGRQRERMQEVRRLIRAGQFHEAEHEVEEMLAGQADPGLSAKQLHLRLALGAAEADQSAEVRHQLVHFRSLVSGSDVATAESLIAALSAGEMHEVEDGIRRLLELPHE